MRSTNGDAAGLVATALAVEGRPMVEPRPPGRRVGGRCHSFSRLTVALLCSLGVPARARCGFGTYTWATTQLAHGGRPLTAEEAATVLDLLADAAAGIADELRRETLSWAEEFQANVSELRTLAKSS